MRYLLNFGLVLATSFQLLAQETIKIPDIGLEEALIDLDIDSNGLTGDILVSDAAYVVNLNVNDPLNNKKLPNVNSKIKSLAGIEHFPNLTRLDCYGNEIKKIDLSKNTKLTFLNCSENKIETLDLSNNPNLVSVSCDSNKLTSLVLGKQDNLIDLYASYNHLTQLDLSECTKLNTVDASSNKIKAVVVNPTIASEVIQTWYKDANTVFTTDAGVIQPVVKKEPVKTTNNVATTPKATQPQPQTANSTANYYEKFQLSVVAEYDQLVLAPAHVNSKQTILQQKYNISKTDLLQWIAKYGNLKKNTTAASNGIIGNPEKNTNAFQTQFKQAVVKEYEALLLNQAYIQSKKLEIQKKYKINPTEFDQWMDTFGTPALRVLPEKPNGSPQSYFEKYKESVVIEYEDLVLNPTHIQTVKAKVQKKYNLSDAQIGEWIHKHSKVNTK